VQSNAGRLRHMAQLLEIPREKGLEERLS